MSIVKTVLLLLTAILSISPGAAMAADYKLNPFALAYDGAITNNVKGKVNIHGNTHFLMSDLNNLEIADQMSRFLEKKRLN